MAHTQTISIFLFVVLLLGWTAGILLNMGPYIHLLLVGAITVLIASIVARRKATHGGDA